jgi:hypothetical protein
MGSDEATKQRKAVLARTISNILGWTRIDCVRGVTRYDQNKLLPLQAI